MCAIVNTNVKLSLKNIYQNYGEKATLNGIDLDIFKGELIAILGPSGCGKTSLLKSIAGLIPIQNGTIALDDNSIEKLPPQKRNTAMIFQNYALFPHMNVLENLEYGLKIKNNNSQSTKNKIENIIEITQLKGLEERMISQMSGGQQQRVAIGRALVIEPSIILFDEPLSNLDESLRLEMRDEIKKILKKVNITSIYVTHDQNEAMAIADRIVVMKEGEIEQIALPHELYYHPVNKYVANFMGHKNIFDIDIKDHQFILLNQTVPFTKNTEPNTPVKALLRSEDISIFSLGESVSYKSSSKLYFEGRIIGTEALTNIYKYKIESNGDIIHVTVLNQYSQRKYCCDEKVVLSIDIDSIHFMYQ